MAKETFYFSHDYEPTSDPKIQALLGQYGAIGYGLYWRIVEMLHSSDTHKLPTRKYLIIAIAKQMLSTTDFVNQFITDCVGVFELFEQENDMIFSNRVFRNIQKREDIKEKRKAAGSKGGKANAKQMLSKGKAKGTKVKESKGNKKKDTNANAFVAPTVLEMKTYFIENDFPEQLAERVFKYYTELNWHTKDGKEIKSWKAQMQSTWFKPEHKITPIKTTEEVEANGLTKKENEKIF